ncbi:HNH endonuclease [Scytonema hofmannii FACHB-248]|uniref:HNH endonuclease n=1 Tax=Scytonema hofmannii FACHB-248 TaxID=1842502 RepID=A0ABR8GPP1_9CYAN|nr:MULTISPECIES: RNA-guided endonuclease IscB [Nostocales]MBD2605415.1 HNH endonuclease [Scytonema hofmannii FACHB-248]
MSNFVFLIDANKQPLDPIPPGQARRLLNQGHAAVYRRYPFTLILKKIISDPKVKPHQLKIDPGSKVSGLAILQEDKVIWGAELTHRGQQIKNDLESRRAIRCNRRNRKTRYRQPRFLNRTRQKGWLPPSLESRIKNILTWVNRIIRYVPITGISQELVKFDLQATENPEISGKEYQQGTLAGYETREYLLEKWNRKCAYCGVENVPFEVEHIHPKSKGGTDRVSNLTLACHECNQAKGNLDIKEFLAKKPAILSRILSQAKQPLKDAAAVNSTRWALFDRLKKTELPLEIGTGGRTKYNRVRLELPKKHWIDAAAVGMVESLQLLASQPLLITAKGWGSRQMCTPNKYGFPIRHKTRCKTFFGFQTGDMVRAILPSGKFAGTHIGRLTVRESGVFEMKTPKQKVSPVRYKYCKSVHRNDGYMYFFSTNVQ